MAQASKFELIIIRSSLSFLPALTSIAIMGNKDGKTKVVWCVHNLHFLLMWTLPNYNTVCKCQTRTFWSYELYFACTSQTHSIFKGVSTMNICIAHSIKVCLFLNTSRFKVVSIWTLCLLKITTLIYCWYASYYDSL